MRHLKSGRKLSRRKEHRTAMLANLAASIIQHGRVHTTDAKAKEVRPFIERMVTFARRGDLHARRIVLSRLKGNQPAVKKLFDEIGPRFAARSGGYTRIIKLGFRQGDNSSMSLIEFVGEEIEKKAKGKRQKEKGKKQKVEKSIEVFDDKSAVEEIEKSDEVRSDDDSVEENGTKPDAEEEADEVISEKLEVGGDEPAETVLENNAEEQSEKEK